MNNPRNEWLNAKSELHVTAVTIAELVRNDNLKAAKLLIPTFTRMQQKTEKAAHDYFTTMEVST